MQYEVTCANYCNVTHLKKYKWTILGKMYIVF